MASSVWYAVLRAFPWESVVVAGEPLRNPIPAPGEPERMIPLFSTEAAAIAWGNPDDRIMGVVVGEDAVTHG